MSDNVKKTRKKLVSLGETVIVQYHSRVMFTNNDNHKNIDELILPRRTNAVKFVERIINHMFPVYTTMGNVIRFSSNGGYEKYFNDAFDNKQYGNQQYTVVCNKINTSIYFTIITHECKKKINF